MTLLSYGGGQDSFALLLKYIHSDWFRWRFVPKHDMTVIFADTLNEHQHTYDHIESCAKPLCAKHNIPFLHLFPQDWAPRLWRGGLVQFYRDGNRCGSKAFPKTCTDNLKIQQIYNWLDASIGRKYGWPHGRKLAIKLYRKHFWRIPVLIGIAKGEEKRATPNHDSRQKWMRECIDKKYPLISMGMTRKDCQEYIQSVNAPVPYPSNCRFCPFLSERELLWLHRRDPEGFAEWVDIERKKLEANAGRERNLGVFGTRTLEQVLSDAEAKYGYMSDEELDRHKFTHGHCVTSRY